MSDVFYAFFTLSKLYFSLFSYFYLQIFHTSFLYICNKCNENRKKCERVLKSCKRKRIFVFFHMFFYFKLLFGIVKNICLLGNTKESYNNNIFVWCKQNFKCFTAYDLFFHDNYKVSGLFESGNSIKFLKEDFFSSWGLLMELNKW